MTADTTQPAGALPEPVERLLRLANRWADNIGSDEESASIDSGESAVRAMMAERDAARAQSERWAKSVDALRDERDALRQSLWDVYAALGCDTDGDPTPAALVGDLGALVLDAAKEAAKDYREACDAIPPDAREGREPLTLPEIKALSNAVDVAWSAGRHEGNWDEMFARAIEAAHGIGPAGTSAEGLTVKGACAKVCGTFPVFSGTSADGETQHGN